MTRFSEATGLERRCSRLPAVLLLALIMNACSIKPPATRDTTTTDHWQQHSSDVSALKAWDLKGRIAIQKEKESASASLMWQQAPSNFKIRIFGPFGKGSVELLGDESRVSMLDAEGRSLEAKNAETLLQDYLGWQVPVSGLYYWVRGIPNPQDYVQTMILDADSRLQELRQSGWHIRYKRYQSVKALHLPARLELQNRELKVKLVLREWVTGP